MVRAGPPRGDGTTMAWIPCPAMAAATTGRRVSAPHITTPWLIASATVVSASKERMSV